METLINIKEVNLDIDTIVPLGLILNEPITNAFKYAFDKSKKGILSFTLLRSDDDRYTLSVQDNGKGMDLGNAGTLGLRLISNLSVQIGGGQQLPLR